MDNNYTWDWQIQDSRVEDGTTIDLSKSQLTEMNQNKEHPSLMFDDESTPAKVFGNSNYHIINHVTGKELENSCWEPSKRRRMLRFESEVLDEHIYNDDEYLTSKETQDSLGDDIFDMAQLDPGFDGLSGECLDPLSEGWIADCLNDAEMMHFDNEAITPGAASDAQNVITVTEVSERPPDYNAANAAKKNPIHTRRNVVFKGKKSYMRTLPKPSSSIVYPFAFIKPCGAHGDITLKDINQKIHNPTKPKQNDEQDDLSVLYPKSAFSGKPVVGKTKIRTVSGEGSITIMRTKG